MLALYQPLYFYDVLDLILNSGLRFQSVLNYNKSYHICVCAGYYL